jgi:gas vesicle protein
MVDERDYRLEQRNGSSDEGRGGFVALAVIAAALGAGAAILLAPEEGSRTRRRVSEGLKSFGGEAASTIAQLQRDLRRRRNQSRREKRVIALAGLLIGAGLAALLTPESGTATRRRLGGTLSRIKVGTVDRIERLRQRREETGPASAEADSAKT